MAFEPVWMRPRQGKKMEIQNGTLMNYFSILEFDFEKTSLTEFGISLASRKSQ